MRQILFVQGAGKDVHEQWDNKLVESLRRELGPGYDVRYPLMPDEADPQVAAWRAVIERGLAELQSGAIVVGHSIGGTILINTLADRAPAVELGAIALVAAPFVGKGGWKSDGIEPRSDLATRLPARVPVFLYHGDKDDIAPVAHVALYAAAIPYAHVRRLANRDHQLDNNLSEVASDIRKLEMGFAMSLGFTGTRRGMTDAQRRVCARLLAELQPTEVHHGDALGADAEFHELARAAGARIVVHPPTLRAHRAFCTGDEELSPKSKTARDRDVVDATDLLIATPADPDLESFDSGTWYTLQYAAWSKKPVVIVWPDGSVEEHT